VKDNEPVALFEAKESETGIDKSGMFYSKKNGNPLVSDRSQNRKGRSVSRKMLYHSCFKLPYAYRIIHLTFIPLDFLKHLIIHFDNTSELSFT
jgi:hypothetical protein